MRVFTTQALWILFPAVVYGDIAASISYSVPATPPTGASSLDPAPVGVS
jgi:hypothetical protein